MTWRVLFSAMILCIACLSEAASAAPAAGATVFVLDKDYRPVIRLERVKPLSGGVRAILAMSAFQAGGGCSGNDDAGLKCELTHALGLGAQCSKRHLELVRSWFRGGMPPLGGNTSAQLSQGIASGDLASLCYAQPDTATYQNAWQIIRARIYGDTVTIDATSEGGQVADGPLSRNRFSTTYRIGPSDVTVVEHHRLQ